ncbi:MAG: WYL domain-containing protein [bacterium]
MKKKPKISSTAYRVLLLMQMLNGDDYSIDNLNNAFSSEPSIARILSKEVIVKYITTIRLSGYNISKPCSANNYTYKLTKAPVTIKLSEEELKTFIILENYVSSLYQQKLQKNYNSFIKKFLRFLSDEQISMLNQMRKNYKNDPNFNNSKYTKYATLIKTFEQYCIEDQRVIVKYKLPYDDKEKQIILEPKAIKYDSDNVYISGYNPITGEKQSFHMDYIQEIKQLPVKSKFNYVISPVIFKLKGRLAKGYRPYEGEKITEADPDDKNLTIAAYVDDKNMLLHRLLKYGNYCEIIYPKYVRDKAIKIIQDTLKNYENAAV